MESLARLPNTYLDTDSEKLTTCFNCDDFPPFELKAAERRKKELHLHSTLKHDSVLEKTDMAKSTPNLISGSPFDQLHT
jgi:hypothetical protein